MPKSVEHHKVLSWIYSNYFQVFFYQYKRSENTVSKLSHQSDIFFKKKVRIIPVSAFGAFAVQPIQIIYIFLEDSLPKRLEHHKVSSWTHSNYFQFFYQYKKSENKQIITLKWYFFQKKLRLTLSQHLPVNRFRPSGGLFDALRPQFGNKSF